MSYQELQFGVCRKPEINIYLRQNLRAIPEKLFTNNIVSGEFQLERMQELQANTTRREWHFVKSDVNYLSIRKKNSVCQKICKNRTSACCCIVLLLMFKCKLHNGKDQRYDICFIIILLQRLVSNLFVHMLPKISVFCRKIIQLYLSTQVSESARLSKFLIL